MTAVWAVTPETITGPGGWTCPTPAGMMQSIPDLFRLSEMDVAEGELTIILAPQGMTRDDLYIAITDAGWHTNRSERGWFTCLSPGKPTIHLACVEHGALADLGPELRDIREARRWLTAWAERMYIHYRHTPGVSALASMTAYPRSRRPQWHARDADGSPWPMPCIIRDIVHKPGELMAPGYRHQWDTRNAYLAAMAAVELPYRTLEHTGALPHTLDCGLFRVQLTSAVPWPSWMMPDIDRQGCGWITSSEIRAYRQVIGMLPLVVDSYTPAPTQAAAGRPGHGRILRSWAEFYRDSMPALASTDFGATKAPKRGYAEAVGLMNRVGGSVYRPDWRALIIGHVRAAMMRRVAAVMMRTNATVLPSGINVDAIYYDLTDTELTAVRDAIGEHDRIGGMRYEGTV